MNKILTLAVAGILFAGIGTAEIANAQAAFGRQQPGAFQPGPQGGFGFGMMYWSELPFPSPSLLCSEP